jgi:hypothetical protein
MSHPAHSFLDKIPGDPFGSFDSAQSFGFQVASMQADPYRTLIHADLPGYAILTVPGEPILARDRRWVDRLVSDRQRIADHCLQTGDSLLISPATWVVFQEQWGRLLIISEWPDLLPPQENLLQYRTLSSDQVERLVRDVVALKLFRLHPTRMRFTCDKRLFWEGRLEISTLMTGFRRGLVDYLDPSLSRFAYQIALQSARSRALVSSARDPFKNLAHLMASAELKEQLDQLFTDPVDFLDRESIEQIGFKPRERGGHLLWVLGHPSLPNHFIKTFPLVGDKAEFSVRLRTYLRRMKHARALREYVEAHQLERIVVARKQLYRLPDRFKDPSAPHGRAVMVVDRFDLLDRKQCHEAYLDLDRESVEQLIELWRCVGGFEGLLQNMPITVDGKIALVDTEKGAYHKALLPTGLLSLLNPEMASYAVAFSQRFSP